MIVTEFVEGERFDWLQGQPEDARNEYAEKLFRFYCNGPFRHRLLNGDPHPGNSLFMADGRVAFIDFGFFKRMSVAERDTQLRILRAVYDSDEDALFAVSVEQGIMKSDAPADARAQFMQHVRGAHRLVPRGRRRADHPGRRHRRHPRALATCADRASRTSSCRPTRSSPPAPTCSCSRSSAS